MIRPAVAATLAITAALLVTAAAPPAQLPIQPGRWTQTITVTDIQMPGATAGMAQSMRGRPTTISTCITPQQAADGPRAALQRTIGTCHYTSYSFANGRLASTFVCTRPSGTLTTQTSGSFTPVAMDVVAVGNSVGRSPMRMTTHVTGHRVGAC